MSLNYNGDHIPFAKHLRKHATRQENHLWYDFLSTYPIRFQRQKTIDNFIADFYCHKARLVIEIDGSQHYSDKGVKCDQFRTDILEGLNLFVIRFTNEQVDRQFREVCEYIDGVVKNSLSQLADSSLWEGACTPSAPVSGTPR